MITQINFHNFRILRDATLQLSPVTVLIGPNGSGKSTALESLRVLRNPEQHLFGDLASVGTPETEDSTVCIELNWKDPEVISTATWRNKNRYDVQLGANPSLHSVLRSRISTFRVYSLEANKIAEPIRLERNDELGEDGSGLARVLTNLQDQEPERWESLNAELGHWMPDFDRILLDTPQPGKRSFFLRLRQGRHPIQAKRLSQGTLLALAMLTLAHHPTPPAVIGLEEPDRGVHPRLLRDIQDAIFRLADPKAFGDARPAVQVIVTTHSPYFIDLFRDQPESVVIASKQGLDARFDRLSDQPNFEEILRDSHLGEAWYTGVLGGVPAGT